MLNVEDKLNVYFSYLVFVKILISDSLKGGLTFSGHVFKSFRLRKGYLIYFSLGVGQCVITFTFRVSVSLLEFCRFVFCVLQK